MKHLGGNERGAALRAELGWGDQVVWMGDMATRLAHSHDRDVDITYEPKGQDYDQQKADLPCDDGKGEEEWAQYAHTD